MGVCFGHLSMLKDMCMFSSAVGWVRGAGEERGREDAEKGEI